MGFVIVDQIFQACYVRARSVVKKDGYRELSSVYRGCNDYETCIDSQT